MTAEEWTPERPGSPWNTHTPWLFLTDEKRDCQFHGEYISKLVKADQPPGWEERLKKMSKAEQEIARPLFQDWWTKCPKCDDQIHEEQVAHHKEAIHGHEERLRLRLLRASEAGIPKRYSEAHVFDNLVPPLPSAAAKISKVRNWANQMDINLQSGKSLLIMGSVGTGKTHVACAIANFALGKGLNVRFTTEQDMFEEVKATFSENSETTTESVSKKYSACDLLVVDEVGRYGNTAFDDKMIGNILNIRYMRCRPTIMTTNFNEKDMAKHLRAAIWSRIKGNLQTVTFTWQDLRDEFEKDRSREERRG